jgi:hypothetical protein
MMCADFFWCITTYNFCYPFVILFSVHFYLFFVLHDFFLPFPTAALKLNTMYAKFFLEKNKQFY